MPFAGGSTGGGAAPEWPRRDEQAVGGGPIESFGRFAGIPLGDEILAHRFVGIVRFLLAQQPLERLLAAKEMKPVVDVFAEQGDGRTRRRRVGLVRAHLSR